MKPLAARLGVALVTLIVFTLGAVAPLSVAEDVDPIDLNRASAKELTRLPGIGEAIAKRIVDFRDRHGPFKHVDDLMKVKGIGEKSLEKIRPHVRVGKAK